MNHNDPNRRGTWRAIRIPWWRRISPDEWGYLLTLAAIVVGTLAALALAIL
jgi:hypothetical protein